MENQNENTQVESAESGITFVKFILKILAGIGAGMAGTLVVLIISLATSSLLEQLTSGVAGTAVSPIVIFVLVLMVFVGSIGANLLGATFTYFVDKAKYSKIYSAIIQIVISNVVLMLLMLPVYFLAIQMNVGNAPYVAALHFLLGAQISNLTLEIMANPRYGLLGVYSTTVAIILSMVLIFAIYGISQNATLLLFIALPIIWSSIGFAGGLVEALYSWFASTWGLDLLSANVSYGSDYYAGADEQDKEEAPKDKDVSGSEFLKKG